MTEQLQYNFRTFLYLVCNDLNMEVATERLCSKARRDGR